MPRPAPPVGQPNATGPFGRNAVPTGELGVRLVAGQAAGRADHRRGDATAEVVVRVLRRARPSRP